MKNFRSIARLLQIGLAVVTLAACATQPETPQMYEAGKIAAQARLQKTIVPAMGLGFVLTTYARITDLNEPIVVYIEGEDQPFSLAAAIDLTPVTLPGLRLASIDPSANVIYVARPCQLTVGDKNCEINFLKQGRFSDMVSISVNRAINRHLAAFPHPLLHLVGHGDGGALAALLASRRTDVASLRTIAGNLDPTGLARYLGYDGADDLIDPMPIAKRLASLPQEHYVGDKDSTVPAFLTANFLKEIGATYCATLVRVPDATHDKGWEAVWAANVRDRPLCGKKQFVF